MLINDCFVKILCVCRWAGITKINTNPAVYYSNKINLIIIELVIFISYIYIYIYRCLSVCPSACVSVCLFIILLPDAGTNVPEILRS